MGDGGRAGKTGDSGRHEPKMRITLGNHQLKYLATTEFEGMDYKEWGRGVGKEEGLS